MLGMMAMRGGPVQPGGPSMTLHARTRGRELIAYFLMTFALSWAIQVPLALRALGVLSTSPPMGLHYVASFGPLVAALAVTLVSRGLAGCRELLGRVLRWRAPVRYYVFAVSPVVVFGVIVLGERLVTGERPALGVLGEVDYLGPLGVLPALALWMATFGLGEEVGWRGFALPRLQATRGALGASLVLGAFWAVWHLPAIVYRDTYRELGWMVVPMLLCVATVGPVVYTWLFNGTRGSLVPVILFHGLFDFFSVWPAAGALGPGFVMTVLLVFWAVRVYKVYGAATLSPEEKVAV